MSHMSTIPQAFEYYTTKARQLIERKNNDYAGTDVGRHPLANLTACEILGVPAQRGVLVRLLDKLMRLNSLIDRPPHVVEESFDDTVVDVINYAVLLGYIHACRSPRPLESFETPAE